MIDYKYIDSDKKMKNLLQKFREENIIHLAVDLEAEFNLHCYGEHLCLLQVYDGSNFLLNRSFKNWDSSIKGVFGKSQDTKDILRLLW